MKSTLFASQNPATLAWWVIAATVAAHLALAGLPAVNLEWTFSDAARYFSSHKPVQLEEYFHYEANTFGVPLLSWLLGFVLPVNMEYIPRLVAIAGFLLLGDALLRFNRLLGEKIHPALLLALVFINPLVWTFGGRGTADFIPAALGLFSVALLWTAEKKWQSVLAVLLLGIAIVLKYHAGGLLALVGLEVLMRPKMRLGKAIAILTPIGIGVLVLPVAYLVAVKHTYGFWVTPPVFQQSHALGMANLPINLIAYTAYLALLTAPLSLAFLLRLERSQWIPAAAIAMLLFAAGYVLVRPQGEMSFGPLDGILGAGAVGGAFLVLAGAFAAALWDGMRAYPAKDPARRYALCILAGMLLFVLAFSLSKPAQRYLLFVLPLFYFYVLPTAQRWRSIIVGTTAVAALLNIIITGHQYATGTASMALTAQVISKGILQETDAGAVEAHAGRAYFPYLAQPKHYKAVEGRPREALFSATSGQLPFMRRTFSVIPGDEAP